MPYSNIANLTLKSLNFKVKDENDLKAEVENANGLKIGQF